MNRLTAISVVVLLGALAGCETPLVVPSGAVQIHVTMDASGIHVEPQSVRAGDVYLVIDTPNAMPVLLQGTGGEGDRAGRPLSDERLARVMAGDPEGLMISTGFPAGGQMGSASLMHLVAGKLALATHEPAGVPFAPGELVVVTVTP